VTLASLVRIGYSSSAAPAKFLIVSAPREGKVAYKKIGKDGFLGSEPMQSLISVGLTHPQGVAVDKRTGKLLVADPDSKQVLAYKLKARGSTLSAIQEDAVMKNVEARWVAVDGFGNVYATDEPSNRILKITASQIDKGDAQPNVLYDGMSLTQVSGPGGIGADNYNTFWVNKQIGTQAGSLIKGSVAPEPASLLSSLQTLAKNTDKSYGLCVAMNNVFYTQPEGVIYAVKKTGSQSVQTVSDKLSMPRGCAWDGDGTVYVADRGANAIYSFAGNMPHLETALLQKAADFEDAFGVAVFSGAVRRFSLAVVTFLLALHILC
jgi:sugar lactone lactonase YvrE